MVNETVNLNDKTKPTEEQQKKTLCVWYDNNMSADVMFISIPIKELAANPLGTIIIRGFADEDVKNMALYHIKRIRTEAASKLIQPATSIPADLKIIQ